MTSRKLPVPSTVGTGLIVLDITVSAISPAPAYPVWAGGTCGNVLAILSFLGWKSHAVGRIGNDAAGTSLLRDLLDAGVDPTNLAREEAGTPIILHRIIADRRGGIRHGYSFECPQCDRRYPSFRPVLVSGAEATRDLVRAAKVFFFDRVSRGILDMATVAQENDAIVFFEPSAAGDEKQFIQAYERSDVVKYARDRRPKFEPGLEKASARRRAPLEIETRGAEGLVFRLRSERRWRTRAAKSVPHLRDASGAGDWLTAGFLYAAARERAIAEVLAEVDAVERALEVGEALASYNCQFEGPRGAMYASTVDASTQMLAKVDAQLRRRLTSETKRPALQMTLTGICSACVATKKGASEPALSEAAK
jgi:sugar/nucleoside kinase (ribokinase family)